ncbi:MAG: prepilin-type N-terminal cleavage/methylation domain-containing protein, partial [Planctomycetota bacterium]
MNPTRSNRIGLTLLELVVVLVILAALTGVAVQSLSPIADQARYESTQRTLENVRDAIQDRHLVNGSLDYSGFISDMGRLPVAYNIGGVPQPLELWRSDLTSFGGTADLVPYQIRQVEDPFIDTDADDVDHLVPVASGWRGPYLQLDPGSEFLLDGYGRPMVSIADDNLLPPTPATSGSPIVNFGSTGADSNDASDDLLLATGIFDDGQILGSLSV